MLVLLVLVAMPIKYIGDNAVPVQVIGTAHGWLFAGYLALTFDLARRTNWPLRRTLGVMVSGTIPFLSFVVERKVNKWLAAEGAKSSAGTGADTKTGAAEAAPAEHADA